MTISGKTKFIVIFGDPVEHTLSPAMHNAAFAELGLDYAYIPFHVKPEDLSSAVRGIKAMGIAGANITVPHKERVLEFLDDVDDEAKRLGAVNTIVNRDGKLIGYNTDGRGFVRSLKEDAALDPALKKVYMCGSGGAARGIGFALAAAGVRRVYLYDVDIAKMDRLIADLNSGAGRDVARPSKPDPDFIRSCDLVVNATPLGMHKGDPAPMPPDSFRVGQVVYDIIYNPPQTETLRSAVYGGAKAVNGLGMLLYQGVIAFEHWLGVSPPVETMKKALIDGLGQRI